MRVLGILLLVALVVVLGFFMLGGRFDLFVDADVNPPNVEVSPGDLPDVDVEPAESPEAGDES
jgi:hypothetical protein